MKQMLGLNNQKGFTMVELLISLGLLGLVISTAGMMYLTGVKGFDRSENQVEVQQNLRIAMNVLNSEIRKADKINIVSEEKKIELTYSDNSTKSYIFNSISEEIRLMESNSTVAMYIKDCQFHYANNLIQVSLTNQNLAGVLSRTYTFNINARGKDVHVQ